jgi:cytochrome b involved in lipid metabolism
MARLTFFDTDSGGDDILLELGGQDASEAYDDVKHSEDAHKILEGLMVGILKRSQVDIPKATTGTTQNSSTGWWKSSGGSAKGPGVVMAAALIVGGLLASGAYQYLQIPKTL